MSRSAFLWVEFLALGRGISPSFVRCGDRKGDLDLDPTQEDRHQDLCTSALLSTQVSTWRELLDIGFDIWELLWTGAHISQLNKKVLTLTSNCPKHRTDAKSFINDSYLNDISTYGSSTGVHLENVPFSPLFWKSAAVLASLSLTYVQLNSFQVKSRQLIGKKMPSV